MTKSLPSLSCNTHCHVIGPKDRFPYDPASPPPRSDAPKEALFALNDRNGLERCVIVQSKVHGYDNRATEDAIAARPQSYRGIALLPCDVDTAELQRLNAAGFRGVRFNYMQHLGEGEPIENVLQMAARIEPLGWHLQIHGSPNEVLTEVVPKLLEGPVPIVIDHIARLDASLGMDQPLFTELRRLLVRPNCWVKVSGIDRITRQGPPYLDAIPFAKTLVEDQPDRLLWGNDWPHPNHQGPIPDDADLVRHIHDIAPDGQALQALMVDNPARLYRFGDHA